MKVQDPLRGKWEVTDLKQHVGLHKRMFNMWRKLAAPRRTIQEPTGHRDKLHQILEYPTIQFSECFKKLELKSYKRVWVL